jgi:hypothetical protein
MTELSTTRRSEHGGEDGHHRGLTWSKTPSGLRRNSPIDWPLAVHLNRFADCLTSEQDTSSYPNWFSTVGVTMLRAIMSFAEGAETPNRSARRPPP